MRTLEGKRCPSEIQVVVNFMGSGFYRFVSFDQTGLNWLTRITDKDGDGYGVRFQYLDAFCPVCTNFNQDVVFEKGFEHTLVRIRVRKGRNILVTNDGFLCVSSDVLKALKTARVKGFESKPIYTGMYWHVLRITDRRRCDSKSYHADENPCKYCRRKGQYGGVQYERQIELPEGDLTFFSTDNGNDQRWSEVLLTDKVREVLQKAGAKGGELHKLWTAEEEQLLKADKWKPKKGDLISLGQHRYGVRGSE